MKMIAKDTWVVLGVLVVMGAAAAFVYVPQSRKLNELRGEVVSQEEAIKMDLQRAAVVPEIRNQVQEMRSRYINWQRRLPKQKELGQFLREISTQISDQSLSNQVIEPGNPAREELYHTLPIIMKFGGPYPAMAQFLKGLENMERLTRVQRIRIKNDPKKDGEVDVELRLNIYFTES
ncbi:MAG TPA: hypothetical protein DCX07_05935 [Phycisphaerales bacterium]|nr:hypothetical protein [Phycisphaerales bacterium]